MAGTPQSKAAVLPNIPALLLCVLTMSGRTLRINAIISLTARMSRPTEIGRTSDGIS
jgi:hypothetical protein